jgi:hypothetical protein
VFASPLTLRRHLTLSGVRSVSRADLAVLGFCALGAGSLWARRGAGNVAVALDTQAFVVGFALLVLAGVCCYLAVGRPASLPGAAVCTTAIAVQTLVEPAYLMPLHLAYGVGLVLAVVPLVRSGRAAWPLVVAAGVITAASVATAWTWGSSEFDVFTQVQGSTQALLHGQNPYAPVYSIFLDSGLNHPTFGSGSFGYGPMVVLLSLPARLLGDVRLTVVAVNLAILVAILMWTRRAAGSGRLGPTITALWLASPFVPFMVLTEWTDTFCIAGFAWWLLLRDRHRAWATVALTIGMASKPSMLPLLVPLVIWVRSARIEVLWSALATVVVVAPFAVWTGLPQFVYDTVGIYGDLPTRHDAVNINGLAVALGHGVLPGGLLMLGAAVTVMVFALRRLRDYGDLIVAGAGLLTVLCFFGKQAFLNYYFNAAIALLFVAGSGRLVPRDAPSSPLRVLSRLARLRRHPGDRHELT